ncbi:MAG: transporter ATP-binding protein [Actinomycetia bacterium]|nr:transporter ATP-binding protein [Actinomycetes bacterium]
MAPEGTIHAERIWKRFRPDLRTSMARAEFDRLRERLGGPALNWQWALRDVTLRAEPGESVGLVGDNGSGKSTLLKIVCGVMHPYAAQKLDVVGRMGALIEVRAGIQPDLTGRENIALYGTLLGLTRAEVMARFDAIVDFAQLDFAIDRQVKFYSSGMQMRLGFSVAAFLEPAILLVDEVLAVGDAQFQQRCLDRMRAVIDQGTTVVFVSHDLAAVGSICQRAIWLHHGVAMADGTVKEILAAYRGAVEAAAKVADDSGGLVRVANLEIDSPDSATPTTQHPLELRFQIEAQEDTNSRLFVGISEGTADPIFVFRKHVQLSSNGTEVRCTLPRLPLPRGRYYVWFGAVDHTRGSAELSPWHPLTHFDVYGPELDSPPTAVVRRAPVHADVAWEVSNSSDVWQRQRGASPSVGTTDRRFGT